MYLAALLLLSFCCVTHFIVLEFYSALFDKLRVTASAGCHPVRRTPAESLSKDDYSTHRFLPSVGMTSTMLNRIVAVQECDATENHSSNEDDYTIIHKYILIIFKPPQIVVETIPQIKVHTLNLPHDDFV